HLKNRWEFFRDPAGTRVEFMIDFAFRSRILDAMLHANFDRAVGKLMHCFEQRAQRLYGPKA
ncbi:MAG: type II toxin-antitoxin system RatA family toxin, partial [Brevundimonas sp.]|nr:type II toxin-antitoxin system RatA family toxin [Brevundimonas sp.]